MRAVLDALDWVRGEMWRFSSPDFIRQRELEKRVHGVIERLTAASKTIRVPGRRGLQRTSVAEKRK